MANKRKILIIGAGPAGLAAAYKLVKSPETEIIIWDKNAQVGGISQTIQNNGWRFDLGPHRFFTKNKEVNDFWEEILPLQGVPTQEDLRWQKHNPLSQKLNAPDPEKDDRVMLSKNRYTRMFFQGKFFDYPLKLNLSNIFKLGLLQGALIFLSYLKTKISPCRPEISLEDFYINRFGKKLYQFFFKDYTEKVWGLPCSQIPKEWGAQRVKDLSLTKMINDFITKTIGIKPKNQFTSLTAHFSYPKYGAGHFYQTLADDLTKKGVTITLNTKLTELTYVNNQIKKAHGQNKAGQTIETTEISEVISTMPIKDLIASLNPVAPLEISKIAQTLPYRNSIIVAVLYKKLNLKNTSRLKTRADIIPDNWIYVQDSTVKLGRLSIFNNFSEFMLENRDWPLMSLEYFCNDDDILWQQSSAEIIQLAKLELEKTQIANEIDFIEARVVKVEKSYPAYFGAYASFPEIKKYLAGFTNLFPAGRNGQHKYNNMDHSIACGFEAANLILNNQKQHDSLWSINTENEYHEKK